MRVCRRVNSVTTPSRELGATREHLVEIITEVLAGLAPPPRFG
jgi:hypothetical protein